MPVKIKHFTLTPLENMPILTYNPNRIKVFLQSLLAAGANTRLCKPDQNMAIAGSHYFIIPALPNTLQLTGEMAQGAYNAYNPQIAANREVYMMEEMGSIKDSDTKSLCRELLEKLGL